MKLKINRTGEFIQLQSTVIYQEKTELRGDNVKERLTEAILNAPIDESETESAPAAGGTPAIPKTGFGLYEDDEETLIKDCHDQIYQWNIYTDLKNGICLTSSETDRERKPNPDAEPPREIADPLTNEELTECVADLIYETSLMRLGLEE